MVKYSKNTMYEKLLGREEREIERNERETREEGEMREKGAGSPLFIFFSLTWARWSTGVALERGWILDSSFR